MWGILLSTFFVAPSFAETIDQKLNQYIKNYRLVPQSKPASVNRPLILLGRDLFHETRLSGNNNISCRDCHHPMIMTQEGIPLSLGEGAKGIQARGNNRMQGTARVLPRNSPALLNLHNVNTMFWDGRISYNPETNLFITPIKLKEDVARTLKSALAAQALFPLVDHGEMRGLPGSNPIADARDDYEAWDLILEKILETPGYREKFEAAFPGEKINLGHIGEALAEFQGKNFFFADTPYDRYLEGNIEALSQEAKEGMDLFFGKGKCGECHNGEFLSDMSFKNVASPQIGPGKIDGDDYGRFEWNSKEEDRYAFRVPPLRNVAHTAPYFHNGSMKDLEAVVDHFNDIKFSLENYVLPEFKNYIDPIKDHDHSTNEKRYVLLPSFLPLSLGLTNEEKGKILIFLREGLTDVRLKN